MAKTTKKAKILIQERVKLSMKSIKIGIIGGTGYTGVELLRLLVGHPQAELCVITSRKEAGKAVSDLFPSLRGFCDLDYCKAQSNVFDECDVVFSATPNGVAMTYARALLEKGIKLIDLAADFRITDQAIWEQWYGMQHACPELLEQAVYGLPELNRDKVKDAMLIANPGCYPTATTLGLLPLVEQDLLQNYNIIADTKSGVTGAGRGASVANLYSEVADSFKAYAVAGHRHHPEISQTLNLIAKEAQVNLTFVPHLTPMLRGIHATLYADLKNIEQPIEELHDVFCRRYQNEPFVNILPLGDCPDTRSVKASNMCRIALHKAGGSGKLVVLAVEDNLVKGAAGQAIQNMNIAFGLEETTGLMHPGLRP